MSAQRVFYGLIGGLVLAIIGGGFLYNTLSQQLQTQSEQIEAKKAKLAASDDKLRLTLRANAQFSQLGDVNDIIGDILPNTKAQSDIVADVNALADKSGASLSNISFNSSNLAEEQDVSQTIESDYPGLRKLPVTVVVNASYSQLLDFMEEVESNQRKITVESLVINPVESSGFEASLVINFYVRTTNG